MKKLLILILLLASCATQTKVDPKVPTPMPTYSASDAAKIKEMAKTADEIDRAMNAQELRKELSIPNTPIWGQGFYGLQSKYWNCEASKHAFDNYPYIAIAVLWNTFGADENCLRTLLSPSDPRPKFLEIHLDNASCQRANRCGPYELLFGISPTREAELLTSHDPGFAAKVRANAQSAAEFINSLVGVETYVSPELETNQHSPALEILAQIVASEFPTSSLVLSGITGTGTGGNAFRYYEGHSDHPIIHVPCITNLDGVDSNVGDMVSFINSSRMCRLAFVWDHHDNCICDGPFTDPRERTCCPSRSVFDFENAALLQAAKGNVSAPPWTANDDAAKVGCNKVLDSHDGPGGLIWKQSDAHPGVVILFPGRFDIKKPFKTVKIMKGSKVQDTCVFGKPPGYPDKADHGAPQQIWRCNKKATAFDFNVVLHADNNCWRITNPKIRND